MIESDTVLEKYDTMSVYDVSEMIVDSETTYRHSNLNSHITPPHNITPTSRFRNKRTRSNRRRHKRKNRKYKRNEFHNWRDDVDLCLQRSGGVRGLEDIPS